MGREAPIDVGCYDDRSRDLQSYYSGFTKRRLPDSDLCALSLACSRLPPNHIGYMAWLTVVTHTDMFPKQLSTWAVGLGTYLHTARIRRNRLTRAYCPGWRPEWGKRACLDGLVLGIFGPRHVPGLSARAEEFGVSEHTYQKIRDFVAGAVYLAIDQFEEQLQRVMRLKLHENTPCRIME